MAKPNILVVDCDEGFGLMLKEGLENSGHYTSHCVHTGSDALQAVVETSFDMVVVDMALVDMLPATLIKAIQEAKNGLKIMVIPLMGQSVPKAIEALDINGVLTKPCYLLKQSIRFSRKPRRQTSIDLRDTGSFRSQREVPTAASR